jgi:hypothetical protein
MVFGYEEILPGVEAIADWWAAAPEMAHPSRKGRRIYPVFQRYDPSTHRINPKSTGVRAQVRVPGELSAIVA